MPKNVWFKILLTASILSFVVMLLIVFGYPKQTKSIFTPPPFEKHAVVGVPEVPKDLGYSEISNDKMAYSVALCGRVTMEGEQAVVYFTNPTTNTCWLRLRVLDEADNVLGQTDILRPGEYVSHVLLSTQLPVGTKVRMKVMGYEIDTYQSVGAVQLDTTIVS